MKKIFLPFIALALLSPTITLANTNEIPAPQEEKVYLPKIIDNASLLTEEQISKLEVKSAEIKAVYDFDVVILTVPDIGYEVPMTFSSNFYHRNNYHEDGIIFLISMGERDWDFSTFNYGRYVFTDDYGLDYIVNGIIPPLSDGDYYKSFTRFLNYADAFLLEAESGTPYNSQHRFINKNKVMLFAILGAFLISLLIIFFMGYRMNTKRARNLAHEYCVQDSINRTEAEDTYLYTTLSKTAKPKASSSGGGGSSRSGGRSGKF